MMANQAERAPAAHSPAGPGGDAGWTSYPPSEQALGSSPDPTVTPEEVNWSVLAHLSTALCFVIPVVGNIAGPLIVWLVKKDQSAFIAAHARENLNFQITWSIFMLVLGVLLAISIVLIVVIIGIAFVVVTAIAMGILTILNIVFVVTAIFRALDQKPYKFPMAIEFVK